MLRPPLREHASTQTTMLWSVARGTCACALTRDQLLRRQETGYEPTDEDDEDSSDSDVSSDAESWGRPRKRKATCKSACGGGKKRKASAMGEPICRKRKVTREDFRLEVRSCMHGMSSPGFCTGLQQAYHCTCTRLCPCLWECCQAWSACNGPAVPTHCNAEALTLVMVTHRWEAADEISTVPSQDPKQKTPGMRRAAVSIWAWMLGKGRMTETKIRCARLPVSGLQPREHASAETQLAQYANYVGSSSITCYHPMLHDTWQSSARLAEWLHAGPARAPRTTRTKVCAYLSTGGT